MYKCHFCKSVSAPGVRLNRIPTGYRKREYENKIVLSYGYEITKEADACGPCAITYMATPPMVGSDDFKNSAVVEKFPIEGSTSAEFRARYTEG